MMFNDEDKIMNLSTFTKIAAGLIVGVGAIACASSPAPAERLAQPQAAVRAATEMGAANQPKASLYLKLAEDNLTRADRLIREGHNENAELVLMQADADAELALLLAKENLARNDAEAAKRKVSDLRRRVQ